MSLFRLSFPVASRLPPAVAGRAGAGAPALRLQARDRQDAPPPRPVRTVVVEQGGLGQTIVLTGQIQAEKEVALAFRIGGRIIERSVDTGDRVTPDQVVARLDPQNELNTLRSARAALSAAQGRLEQDSNHFDRQQTLLRQGWTTRANFEQAQQALRSAQAAVDDAKAQLEIAEDRVSYTELKAGVTGTITRRAARIRRSRAGRADGLHGGARHRLGRGVRRARPGAAHRAGATPTSSSR